MAITKNVRAMQPSCGKDLDALRMGMIDSESDQDEDVETEEIENTVLNTNNELEEIRRRHDEIKAQLLIAEEEAKKKATNSMKRKMPKNNIPNTSNSNNVQLQDIVDKLEFLNTKVSQCIEQNKTFELKLQRLEYLEANEATTSVGSSNNNKDIPVPKGRRSMVGLITTWLYPNIVNRLDTIQGILENTNQQDGIPLI